MTMNKIIATILLAAATIFTAHADDALPGIAVNNWQITQSGRYLNIDMLLDLSDLNVEPNRAVLITPILSNGSESIKLKAVGIYGRTRYYQYLRSAGDNMISGNGEMIYKASERPDSIAYSQAIPYNEWMNGAVLRLERKEYGCCGKAETLAENTLGKHIGKWFPELVYLTPKGHAEKSRSIQGSALIGFPVNSTAIDPAFRANASELAKITASIDTVKNDKDATITSVCLKGFASPEGKWEHNATLAQGRTLAVKTYVENLYDFPAGIIDTESVPEDWQGLRKYVESSNISNKADIIAAIDSDLEPDAKDSHIKSTFPEQYAFLLENIYPTLRHTDYRIAYDVRHYTDVNEIRRVMDTRPQNLDLDEFYLLAAEYEPGTPEFTEVYETAVRMYPQDHAANLNAANAAMRRGDHDAAERYLNAAGNSSEVTYARAALAIRKKDYATARTLLEQASKQGIAQADETLSQLP